MTEQFKLDENNTLKFKAALGMAPENIQGDLSTQPSARAVVPGLNDIQLAEVSRIGQRGEFIQPHDWENLLPTLPPGRELLWIIRKEQDQFYFYLGQKESGDVLRSPESARQRRQDFISVVNHYGRRAFPESRLRQLDNQATSQVLDDIEEGGRSHLTAVTGVPSPKIIEKDSVFGDRDIKRRPYASLNDVLEPFIDEDAFTLVFSVSKASRDELENELRVASKIRSQLRPLIEGENSRTEGEQKNNVEVTGGAKNKGESATESRNIAARLVQFMTGAKDARGESVFGRGAPVTYQRGETSNWSRQESTGSQWSQSETTHWFNAHYKLIDEFMERRIQHLTQAIGTGAYRSYVAVYSGTEHQGRRIGKTLSATLGGAHSHLQPFQTISYGGNYADFPLRYCSPGHSFLPNVPLLDAEQACQLLLMPDAELPGLSLKKAVFYGRSPGKSSRKKVSEQTIRLGNSAFHEPTMRTGEHNSVAVKISREDILSHLLIAGTTGSGKTMRTIDILKNLSPDDFHIIAIETAKKTYRRYLKRGKKEPTVYSLGGSSGERFRINPFYFDPGSNLKKHVSVLADALNDLLPVEALIGPKLREAVLRCYTNSGWDIESGTFSGEGEPIYPTMIEFNREIAQVCDQLGYSAEINQNYRGALFGRSRLFIDDLYQDLFIFDGEEKFDDIFGQDTILELDDLPPSEINMPAFVTSLVLQRLRAHCERRRRDAGRAARPPFYLVVIEEAHNILHRRLEENQDPRQTGGSRHLLTQVVRLLQEGRDLGIGVMVVDQSPESLADAVRKNTNTKIVHRIVDGGETEIIGKSLGLPEEDWPDLTDLGTGECIVGLKEGGKPIKLAPIIREQLPRIVDREWQANEQEAYGDADRVISELAYGPLSCALVEEVAQTLLKICSDDVIRAGRLVGRWRAWHNRWSDHNYDTYRCARTLDELRHDLFALKKGVEPEVMAIGELAALILNGLYGEGNFRSSDVQDAIFGEEWIAEVWPTFATGFADSIPEMGYDADLAKEVEQSLAEWATSAAEGELAEGHLRWICSNQESREIGYWVAWNVFSSCWECNLNQSSELLRAFFEESLVSKLISELERNAEMHQSSTKSGRLGETTTEQQPVAG